MDLVKSYGNLIKKYTAENPTLALNMIKFGLFCECNKPNSFNNKSIPKAYMNLHNLCVKSTYNTLNNPQDSAWVNIFAPVEILHSFDINPFCIESFSCFMSGFKCEDYFIDYAEMNGIAETLCSYHKNFIGVADSNLLPKPKFALTTSMICDGNINTFRYLCDKHKIPSYILDIPNEYSKENELYVVSQLKEMISMIEDLTGKEFNVKKLREILKIENESKAYMREFFKYQSTRSYPSTLTIQLYTLFTSHILIGTKEALDFYKLLSEDIKNYPKSDALKIFWVHLLPFYHNTLKEYFNLNPHYQIQGYELHFDYVDDLDLDNPLESIAKKMLLNIYNGSYERKIETISKLVDDLNADAVINFCHWGCKQSSGGATLLKNHLNSKNIPMLILDGDGIDRRNSHDGQIKTRLEAFIEMIRKQKSGENNDRICL